MRKNRAHTEAENVPRKRSKTSGKGSLWVLRLNLVLCLLTLLFYYFSGIRPEKFWIAGFTGFFIPLFQVANLVFIGFWLWKRPFFVVFSVFTLVLGSRFIFATVGWHYLKTEPCGSLKVLSFNAKTFGGMDPNRQKPDVEICSAMLAQIIESKAEIVCIQEMFDNPKSSIFNTVERLKGAGYKYVYFSKTGTMRWGASVGMAIFSKYPILSKAPIRKVEGSNNQIIRAKVDVDGQQIVVINMHLQSVFLKDEELDAERAKEHIFSFVYNVIKKLKVAYVARTRQIDLLLASTLDEEIPVIIAGDMNDTPYSNAYIRLADSFQNGFEEKGSGFGITYNGKIPFLRIDHQFANHRLRFKRFQVNRSIVGSDHYATEACYEIVK